MTTLRVSIPGIGGSLGECVVCGKSFVAEILLGKSVDGIRVSGFDKSLPVHSKCGKLVQSMSGPWKEIRDKFPEGPLHRAFEAEYSAGGE